MKLFLIAALLMMNTIGIAQPLNNKVDPDLIINAPDGSMLLSEKGASYFAKLSLECTSKPYPHYYHETLEKAEDLKAPDKLFPSFYGCFDWHSGVHNHWALVKLLKTFPKIPEAKAIKQKLENSFDAKNILTEIAYLKSHKEENFEFPYGQSWLLKVADELGKWDDQTAKKWLKNLQPLAQYIADEYVKTWPEIKKPNFGGDHYASSLGISFALDYAITFKNDELKNILLATSKSFYGKVTNFPLQREPFGYDFMSAGLLIADLMQRVLPQAEYTTWLQKFSPDLFTTDGVKKVFNIIEKDDHSGFESHFDGFHLNRIWCINSMLKALPNDAVSPEVKTAWLASQKKMWNYSQSSIGKGNYDVDHWLSTFSVYALTATK
ncbi:DUF2891 family protein [Ferruginibacter yonginensis]|uniref:DUF2891 family protein n=1 Tax=Ferruginibacter yonginensis TaxID=1310416 RepID=A0ABV8QN95_9BACT